MLVELHGERQSHVATTYKYCVDCEKLLNIRNSTQGDFIDASVFRLQRTLPAIHIELKKAPATPAESPKKCLPMNSRPTVAKLNPCLTYFK